MFHQTTREHMRRKRPKPGEDHEIMVKGQVLGEEGETGEGRGLGKDK